MSRVKSTNKIISELFILRKICIYIKNDIIFASNKTHHASHLNSAPGWVFDLYGGHVL